jgi:hypothetical protein
MARCSTFIVADVVEEDKLTGFVRPPVDGSGAVCGEVLAGPGGCENRGRKSEIIYITIYEILI